MKSPGYIWPELCFKLDRILAHEPHFRSQETGNDSVSIGLVIDAMDLLHSGRFDGFVLVSSDSDFTRLASRIREQGLDVYGMGMQKTPDAFRKACKRFIFLENLDGAPDRSEGRKSKPGRDLQEVRDMIFKAMDSIEQDDEWYRLGDIGQFLTTSNPDFDTRSYGKRKLSDLVGELKVFEIKPGPGNQLLVRRVD